MQEMKTPIQNQTKLQSKPSVKPNRRPRMSPFAGQKYVSTMSVTPAGYQADTGNDSG
jgi:hypothetical protein